MATVKDLLSICYVSRSLIGDDMDKVVDIWEVSERNNELVDITGLLYFDDQIFFQVLEGEEKIVQEKFEKIATDPRHEDVTVLFEYFCATRTVHDMNMKVISKFGDRRRQAMFSWERLNDATTQEISRRIWTLKGT